MGSAQRNVAYLRVEGRVRDLAAVIGYLGLDRFALGALDAGAATAVAYAAQNPTMASHLILLSPWASAHNTCSSRGCVPPIPLRVSRATTRSSLSVFSAASPPALKTWNWLAWRGPVRAKHGSGGSRGLQRGDCRD